MKKKNFFFVFFISLFLSLFLTAQVQLQLINSSPQISISIQTPQVFAQHAGCCSSDGDCPSGEACNQSNGACDSGSSCGAADGGGCESWDYCCNNPGDCNCTGTCPPAEYCGDGSCNNGEDCSSCSGDCGNCAPVEYCGDGSCNNGENCSSCSGDCGDCPPAQVCSPNSQGDVCDTGFCPDGTVCAQGHKYCLWDGSGYGACSEEVNNCAEQCASQLACEPQSQGSLCNTDFCPDGTVCAQGHNYCLDDGSGYGACSEEVNNCAEQCAGQTCEPQSQGNLCDTSWCPDGSVCAQGHVYCLDSGLGYGACSEEVNNCAEQCKLCTDSTYTQCGDVDCNGQTWPANHTIDVVKSSCADGTITYACTDAGVKTGECGNCIKDQVIAVKHACNPATGVGQWCDYNVHTREDCTQYNGSFYNCEYVIGQCNYDGAWTGSCTDEMTFSIDGLASGYTYATDDQTGSIIWQDQFIGGTSFSHRVPRGVSFSWFMNDSLQGSGTRCSDPGVCIQVVDCTSNIVCGGSCIAPSNTCYANNGTQSDCVYTEPDPCTIVDTGTTLPCTVSNCGLNYFCSSGVCSTKISGTVFLDPNKNGIRDAGEAGKSGVAINITGTTTRSTTTDSTGFYSVTLPAGTYSVSMVPPATYTSTTTNPVPVTLGNEATVNFGLAPSYSISGNIFIDINKSEKKEAGEQNFIAAVQKIVLINLSNYAETSQDINNGSYSFPNITSGNYRVEYRGNSSDGKLPAGYIMTYPVNGSPSSYSVTVGPSCTVPFLHDAKCDINLNITDLNFGINGSPSWIQCQGGDCRLDKGFTNYVPETVPPQCGGAYTSIEGPDSQTAGIISSGDSPYIFCTEGTCTPPRSSENEWVVGGTTYPDVFAPAGSGVMRTSYEYYIALAKQSGITPSDLAPLCNGGIYNCTLPSDLANGLYKVEGDLNLNSFIVPANKNYVILVHGDLYIKGDIDVPIGSTFNFSVSGNSANSLTERGIHIDRSVGVAYDSSETSIEGFYSSNYNFIVDGNGVNGCSTGNVDKRLNIAGVVVVNANLSNTDSNSDSFKNKRDMCTNSSCPTVTFVERPDFLINAPDFLMYSKYHWQEIVP